MLFNRLVAPLLAATLSQAALATDLTLTFDAGAGVADAICTSAPSGVGSPALCGNNGYLLQSHGDIPGLLDVSYLAPRQGSIGTLYWWNTSYNNLFGVVWAPGGDSDSEARIDFRPLQEGAVVTLNSFDLGAYSNTTRNTTVSVVELGTGTTLFSYSGPVGNGSLNATAFTPSVSSTKGLRLVWQDSAYNVGVDNISLSVTPVPEANALALAAVGMAVAGLALRRRNRVNRAA
jgi:hypothetical protein